MMDDTVHDGTGLPPSSTDVTQAPSPVEDVQVPDGTLEEQLAWVSEGETQEDRHARANALWSVARAPDGSNESDLSGRLQAAVYQQPGAPATQPEQAATAEAGGEPGGDGPSYEDAAASGPEAATVTEPETVAASPALGEVVQSDTAGTGEAVNAETGAVTAPGEPLPPIEQTEGEQLNTAAPVEVVEQPAPADAEQQTPEQPTY